VRSESISASPETKGTPIDSETEEGRDPEIEVIEAEEEVLVVALEVVGPDHVIEEGGHTLGRLYVN